MEYALWVALAGAGLIFMAVSGSALARWPVSTAMAYMAAGVALSPWGFDRVARTPLDTSEALEHLAEFVVLVSLFTTGLKMGANWHDKQWALPLRLAAISMLVTVALITAVGVSLLGLSLGASVLLAGILAPTDPVLASEVQLGDASDRDKLRFALTGEGGLNDGTAFPVVMLGLGLLGLHELGPMGLRWLAVDVVWATGAGLAVGAVLGAATGRLVRYLRRSHREAMGYDNFLALGLISLSYGVALLSHAYGFLAVFAAGAMLRRVESLSPRTAPTSLATDPVQVSGFVAHGVMSFNEQIERVGEAVAVVALGMILWAVQWQLATWWFVPVVLIGIRPLAVAVGLIGSRTSVLQRRMIGWFGIRGIGSLFYLMYAINQGLAPELASELTALATSVVVASVIVHGVSVTPLMNRYRRARRQARLERAIGRAAAATPSRRTPSRWPTASCVGARSREMKRGSASSRGDGTGADPSNNGRCTPP